MERCCYPETSRDANGSIGFIGLRYCLMWLVLKPTLYSAKTQRVKDEINICLFLVCKIFYLLKDFFLYQFFCIKLGGF